MSAWEPLSASSSHSGMLLCRNKSILLQQIKFCSNCMVIAIFGQFWTSLKNWRGGGSLPELQNFIFVSSNSTLCEQEKEKENFVTLSTRGVRLHPEIDALISFVLEGIWASLSDDNCLYLPWITIPCFSFSLACLMILLLLEQSKEPKHNPQSQNLEGQLK